MVKAVKILAEGIVMISGERDQVHKGIALEFFCLLAFLVADGLYVCEEDNY